MCHKNASFKIIVVVIPKEGLVGRVPLISLGILISLPTNPHGMTTTKILKDTFLQLKRHIFAACATRIARNVHWEMYQFLKVKIFHVYGLKISVSMHVTHILFRN